MNGTSWCGLHGAQVAVWFVALSAGVVATPAFGNPWQELLKTLPGEANAVALLDIATLREAGSSTDRAVAERINSLVPPSIRRMVIAASVDLDSLEADWEVVVGNTTEVHTLEQIAEAEDGYVDDLAGEEVVWSRNGFYLRMLNPSEVGLLRPADRRVMAKWIRSADELPLAPALAQAVDQAYSAEPLFLALDLTDAISQRAVRGRLEGSRFSGVKPRDFDRLAEDIAGVKLVSIAARQNGGLTGRCRIVFSQPPALTPNVLQGIFLEILRRRGAALPDLESWKPRMEQNTLVLSGDLSPRGMQDIISFLAAPEKMAQHEQTYTRASSANEVSAEEQTIRATKSYFDAVRSIVDDLRKSSAKSMGERAMWNDRDARKIDNLPILHVDSEMIDYGTNVASLLRGSGLTIREANLDVGVNKARSSIDYGTYYAVNDNAPQNAQVRAQARSKGQKAYLGNMQQIDEMTAKVRRSMTMKYNVEF